MGRHDDFVQTKVSGGEEILEKLESLPLVIGKAILRKALRAGAKIFSDEMKHRAPRGWHILRATSYKGAKYKGRSREYGLLAKGITTKTSISGDELAGSASVGPSKKTFWGLFQEFGTKHSKAQPFIRSSFDTTKEKALEAFVSTAKSELAAKGMPVE